MKRNSQGTLAWVRANQAVQNRRTQITRFQLELNTCQASICPVLVIVIVQRIEALLCQQLELIGATRLQRMHL